VRDEDDRRPLAAQLVEPVEAAALELLVTDGDDLVDDQQLGVEIGRDREPEPHVHAAGVDLHRDVDEIADAAELDDVVQAGGDLPAAQPEDRPVEEDVLAPGELGVEPGAELEHGRHPAVRGDGARSGPVDTRDQLEQRRLSRAVVADEAVRRPPGDLQRDVAERPEVLGPAAAGAPGQLLLEIGRLVAVHLEALAHRVDDDCGVRGRAGGDR
jgi:hypothetical protein